MTSFLKRDQQSRLKRSRPKRSLALALAISMLLPSAATVLLPVAAGAQTAATSADLAAIHIPTAPEATGPIHTILMFPFVNDIPASAPANGFDGDIVGAQVEDAIKMRLNVIGRYKADSFSPTLPQMQRAVQESGVVGITETDVAPPYDTALKGRKLADQIATDGFLIGKVESIDTNPQTRTVSVTIIATLYNTETGRAVKALAATGHGISYNAADNPASLLQSAVNDAAGHMVSALNADVAGRFAAAPDVRSRHHSQAGAVVLGLLVAAAIAIGITSSHHSSHSGGGGGGGTTIPPPPVTGGLPPNPPFVNP